MNRRKLLLGGAALPVLWLTGCSKRDSDHGPGKMHWDRDTCTRCNMIISDRRFAAQIRGGAMDGKTGVAKRKIYKFDDIGCALFWLQEQKIPWADSADTEIWVTDAQTGEWLDARTAHYLAGKTTPMLYGYGALRAPAAGSVDFQTMKTAILAKGR